MMILSGQFDSSCTSCAFIDVYVLESTLWLISDMMFKYTASLAQALRREVPFIKDGIYEVSVRSDTLN